MGEVITLPTAPSRKVKQRRGRAYAAARRACPRFPVDRYIHPHVREKMDAARLLVNVERTPALAIAVAIFSAMDSEGRGRVRKVLGRMGDSAAIEASALLSTDAMTYGEMSDLVAAMKQVEAGQ